VPGPLRADGGLDPGGDLVVGLAATERGPQVELVGREQAGTELAVGGEADAVAVAAEGLRDRRDDADKSTTVEVSPAVGRCGAARRHLLEVPHRREAGDDLVLADHGRALPFVGRIERHELDEAHLDAALTADAVSAAQDKARQFVTALFQRVAVLDTGARGSTNTFIQRGIGDVLLAWENEAFLAVKDLGPQDVEIVVPSISILAEPPVAVIDKFAERHGTTAVAEAYLKYLYSARGQQLAAKYHYRPVDPQEVPADDLAQFAELELFTIEQVFGSWKQAQVEHFDDGGVFDQIYQPGQ